MIFGLFGGEKKRIGEVVAAARAGDTPKVQQLLSNGIDINAAEPESGQTPLLAALDKGHWTTAELILSKHPDLTREDNQGNSPLYLVVLRGYSAVDMVTKLLDAGAQVDLGPHTDDNPGAKPLYICCAAGANACIKTLPVRSASVLVKQMRSMRYLSEEPTATSDMPRGAPLPNRQKRPGASNQHLAISNCQLNTFNHSTKTLTPPPTNS
jgi:Ankyrin repeats (3 copies)